ncbi:ABC transporter permease subunit [Methanolacinia paynteri]|uniref:ABC transporter permease subunit n=1 Tax=Methanolacinia paynteri TaxID=230356 RepID=UPI00064E1554|nr:ABC transporter permease subunit [Methanolacinia paynteri]
MISERVLIVAKKEFIGNITSKKFFLILILFAIIVGIGAFDGISEYYSVLDEYKSGSSDVYQIPPTPVIVFGSITENLGYYGFGAIIAIALGFNLISGERESGSLKSLLSHPVFRDEIINGKAIGGIFSLLFAETIVFTIVIALMLTNGIVPDLNAFGKICIICFFILLFLIANFSLALMSSAICKSSSSALILSVSLLFIMSYLIPVAGLEVSSYLILGDEPETIYSNEMSSMSASEVQYYQDTKLDYMNKKISLQDILSVFSVRRIFSEIVDPFTRTSSYLLTLEMYGGDNTSFLEYEPSTLEILESIWTKIFALIMFPVIFFGIAYVKFMRMDLR